MLVLSRKLQEQIHIGDNVTVTILRVKGNTVRVGIEAPRDVRVVRGELEFHLDDEPKSNQSSTDDIGADGEDSAPHAKASQSLRMESKRNDIACHAI